MGAAIIEEAVAPLVKIGMDATEADRVGGRRRGACFRRIPRSTL
jgi:hypothetical protein